MTINEYQELTKEFDLYPPENKISSLTLGLASEAGEVAGKVKKIVRDKNGIPDEDDVFGLLSEFGDCIWYIVRLADELGFSAEKILTINIEKLNSRKTRGSLSGSGDNR